MVKGAVLYRGVWLMPGSTALQLHQDGKFKELEEHMKALDLKERRLLGN